MVGRNKIYNKGQAFSIDLLIVVVIVLFGVLFLVMNEIQKTENTTVDINEIQKETMGQSQTIVDEFKLNSIIDDESNVEVDNLLQVDMEQLKEDLNINNDFCIVFEKDGKLVKIDPNNDIYGVGSTDEIIINGVPCTVG